MTSRRTSEHETSEAPRPAPTDGEPPRALRAALREGLVATLASALRVRDRLAAATARPRETARGVLGTLSARARRLADEARDRARGAADDGAPETPGTAAGRRDDATRSTRRKKRAKRS